MKCVLFNAVLVGLVIVSCTANGLDIKDKDLLLYLPFNDDTDDYSIQGNHGEIVGNADFVEGKYGQGHPRIIRGESAGDRAVPVQERQLFHPPRWRAQESSLVP